MRATSLLCAASLAALAPSGAAQAETYLVAIGSNQGRAHEPILRHAERDAELVASVLTELGRISPENRLLALAADADTVRRILLKTNGRIRSALSGNEPKDVLLIYYSGHADALGLHLGDSTVPYEELKAIAEASPAKVRILIIDSCGSGGITRLKGSQPAPAFAIRFEGQLEAEGLAMITSSASSEDSQESDELGASFFTHHLVTALRGAGDQDHDGRVTLTEAYGYAYQQTLRSTGETTRLQHPTYLYGMTGRGSVPLTYLADGAKRWSTLVIPDPGLYLVFERSLEGTVLSEVFVPEGGTEVRIPPDKYVVQRRAEGNYRRYEVQLKTAEKVDLRNIPYDELNYSRLLRKGGGSRRVIHNLTISGSASGGFLPGQSPAAGLMLGYSLDLSSLSLGLALRWGRSDMRSLERDVSTVQDQLALRLRGERFFDFTLLTVGIGVFAESSMVHQAFLAAGTAPARTTFGGGFGASLACEVELSPELILRAETGPLAQLFRTASIEAGGASGSKLSTTITWHAAIGGGLRL